jgi:hypothetical protein
MVLLNVVSVGADRKGMAEATAPTERRRRRRSRLVWALVVSGLVIGVVGFAGSVTRLFGPLFGPSLDVPGSHSMTLDAGRWVVFEENGSQTSVGPVHVSKSERPRIAARDVTVTSTGGTALTVRPVGSTQTVKRGSSSYLGVAEFDIDEAGEYTVTVTTASAGDIVVGREFVDGIKSNLIWLGMSFLGLLLLAAGAVVAVARAFLYPSSPPTVDG